MNTKHKDFLNLLKYSNKLERKNQSLQKINFELFKDFLHFLATIETNIQYFERQEYIELISDFLANQITADEFSCYFMRTYEGINKKLVKMEHDESLELVNFLEPNRPNLGELLAKLYGYCNDFGLESEQIFSDEEGLKHLAKLLLFELQKEETEDAL
jgi:hypothetical protein